MNPSDNPVLIELAGELGLDVRQFYDHLASPAIEKELAENFMLRRNLGVRSFPSLVLASGKNLFPIEVDYRCHRSMLKAICDRLSEQPATHVSPSSP